MNPDETIETPEGWVRQGPCFTRVYGGKFAVIDPETAVADSCRWWVRIYEIGKADAEDGYFTLPEAVAWANDELGVPQPVEVVEIECGDGWLLYTADKNRSARVAPIGGGWGVDADDFNDEHTNLPSALAHARRYVRGDA